MDKQYIIHTRNKRFKLDSSEALKIKKGLMPRQEYLERYDGLKKSQPMLITSFPFL
jgi:hypothetical protein